MGDFRFCLLRKVISPETDIPGFDQRVMELKYLIRRMCGSPAKWYGLESSNIIFEYVPLFSKAKRQHKLTRIEYASAKPAGRPASVAASPAIAAAADDEPEDIFTSAMKDEREKNLADAARAFVGGDTASFKPLVVDEEDEDGTDVE